jgi:hypothetical membrane protein
MDTGLRWLSLCGILAPLLDSLVVGIISALQPNFDPVRDYLSLLTAPEHPDRGFLRAWWISFGIQFAPFAAAYYAGTRNNRHPWIVPILLLVFAFFISLSGVFPCDPGCRGRTISAKLHYSVSTVAALALTPCPFVFWWSTRQDARWRGFRLFSGVIQVAGIATLLALLWAFLNWYPWAGLIERIFWGLYYLWILVIAVKLFQLGGERQQGET